MDTSSQAHPLPDGAGNGELIAQYAPVDGIIDEMVDGAGNIRPGWRELMAGLGHLSNDALSERFGRADQYLRDAGVFYRMFDGTAASEREWPLAHVPLLIEDQEWQHLETGVAQRADLLEAVVADIYGPGDLIKRGLLPASLIAASPEFLRALVGAKPANDHFLHFIAFDLGRGPNGEWRVLGERTQAPSGAGFALENRVALTRALPELHSQMKVERLAGFFRRFRDTLFASAAGPDERVAILTPGPDNETYFEHAYIARYLGISLLEGEDLVVRNGEVMVRTVSGLRPVKVMWRRLDSMFADPIALNSDSQAGTPGLVQAARSGTVSLVNALGVGILETRALTGYLPPLCRDVLGADLQLPSIATWWCGETAARKHVTDNLDKLLIGDAQSTAIAFEDQAAALSGAGLDGPARRDLIQNLKHHGARYVAQEPVRLSTMPAFHGDTLKPHPVTMRVFAARTRDGWKIMPGGFARVGHSFEAGSLAMARGGQAADVWVFGRQNVAQETLLTGTPSQQQRHAYGDLPSRAADNLLWLGRYIERSEFYARMLRAYNLRLADNGQDDTPLLAAMREWLGRSKVDPAQPIPEGLQSTVDRAENSAGRIRDRFSPDGWMALRDLQKTLTTFGRRVQPGDDAASAMTVMLRKLAGFAGLVHENMYRFSGWRFLEIGRRIERASQLTHLCATFTADDAPAGALQLLLEVADSVLTHRRRYNIDSVAHTVIELLVLDKLNPRAVAFQLAQLKDQIENLPQGLADGQPSPTTREAMRLQSILQGTDPAGMSPKALRQFGASIDNLATLIGMSYHGG